MSIFIKEYDKYINSKDDINEDCIEKALIHYLVTDLGYTYRTDINNAKQLRNNFQVHFEKLNNYHFDQKDFDSWWTIFNSGDVYERFITLKSKPYELKVNDKYERTFNYIDYDNIDNNKFEVINQLWTKDNLDGNRRFDVNILINGIPIIHIELKRESCDLKQAGRQIRKYKENEAISDFLNFTKIYIFTNGEETLYLSNNNEIDHNFAFKWSNDKNDPYNKMLDFAKHFLNKKFLLEFIKHFFVFDKNKKLVNVFRPYQYHACKKILNRVLEKKDNKKTSGFVWHATGSGKTMTSFKACEMLANLKDIDKTIFLIDRVDLNKQTFDNFRSFTTSDQLIKNALDTNDLIGILKNKDSDTKIIITTIQKLNHALSKTNQANLKSLRDEKIVFMVDEGHRSQVGSMRNKINEFFNNSINFAFTGTPIFDRNAQDGNTTENIFGEMIHKYTSYDAIKDGNVLPLSLTIAESIKAEENRISEKYDDELMENIEDNIVIDKGRIEQVSKYIIDNFDKLTINKTFNAMLACSSILEAIEYYKMFQFLSNDLKIAIVFSCNKSDNSGTSNISNEIINFMTKRIKEHNSTWDLNTFNTYKSTIQDEFSKERKYDLLIVVSMFLTGFDSPITNTLFLDKHLRYQGLVQAISRPNRLHKNKLIGNIISFKTNIETFNEALTLYTNGDVNTPIGIPLWKMLNYQELRDEFEKNILNLLEKFDDLNEVKNFSNDERKLDEFLKLFKEVMQTFNKIKPLPDFNWNDFSMDSRVYRKYLGVYKTKLNRDDIRVIQVHGDYEIIDLEVIDINKDYLSDLLDKIKIINENDIPDNLEDLDYYKELKDNIVANAKDIDSRDLLLGFIDNKELYRKKTFDEIKILWSRYIEEKINQVESRALRDWSATTKAIANLMEEFKIKKNLDDFDFVKKELPNYVKNELDDIDKLSEIENIIIKLNVLNNIKELIV